MRVSKKVFSNSKKFQIETGIYPKPLKGMLYSAKILFFCTQQVTFSGFIVGNKVTTINS